jgi:DNA-binding response OmpR family regulator
MYQSSERHVTHGRAQCLEGETLKKLLIIDDNELVVNSLVRYCSKRGIYCQGLTNPEKALQLLFEELFDVIITDIHMSPVNGLEIIRYVRAHWPDTLLIGMSAYCDRDYREHASDLGADFFIERPFKLYEIDDALKVYSLRRKVIL